MDDPLKDDIPFPETDEHDEAPVNSHPWWTVPITDLIREWLKGRGKR